MHEIARHAIHSTETITVAIKSLEDMVEKHRLLSKYGCKQASACVRQDLRTLCRIIDALAQRSASVHLRLQNEINLVSAS
jgi:hypothetical protein